MSDRLRSPVTDAPVAGGPRARGGRARRAARRRRGLLGWPVWISSVLALALGCLVSGVHVARGEGRNGADGSAMAFRRPSTESPPTSLWWSPAHADPAARSSGGAASEPQSEPLPFEPSDMRRWSAVANGDEVLALVRDPTDPSRIWAGTESGGILEWDLTRGTFEQSLRPMRSGLADNRVHDIAVSPGGSLWLATASGVTEAPGDGSAWRSWGPADGLPEANVRAIAVDRTGTVWAGTRTAGLASLDAGDDAWTFHPPDDFISFSNTPSEGPGALPVADLAITAEGDVLVAHGRLEAAGEQPALSRYVSAEGHWRHVSAIGPRGDPRRGPITDAITDVQVGPDGHWWVVGWARGVMRYDGRAWRPFLERHGLCGRTIHAIQAGNSGVWVACGPGEGLARFRDGRWTVVPVPASAEGAQVRVMTEVDGRLWLGTDGPGAGGRGIIALDDGTRLSTSPILPPTNDLTSVVIAPDGALWAGTRGHGVIRWDGGRWQQWTRNGTAHRLAGDTVTDLALDGRRLWVTSTKRQFRDDRWQDGGLSVIDTESLQWGEPLLAGAGGLPDGDVGSVAVDDDGALWIGMGAASGGLGYPGTTHHGDGLIRYDPVSGHMDRYTVESTGGALAGDTILSMDRGRDGLWLASSFHHDPTTGRRVGGGVSALNAGRWSSWTGSDGLATFHGSGRRGDRDPWISGDVRTIDVAPDGTVRAGSFVALPENLAADWPFVDAAVSTWDGDRWRGDIFPGDGWVSAIVEDGDGRAWAGTTRGYDVTEFTRSGADPDDAVGGLKVSVGGTWRAVHPGNSGLTSRSIAALVTHPSTGDVWIATMNAGLSIYRSRPPTPTPTATSSPTAPPSTRTPAVTPTSTRPPSPEATPTVDPTVGASRQRTVWLPYVSAAVRRVAR